MLQNFMKVFAFTKQLLGNKTMLLPFSSLFLLVSRAWDYFLYQVSSMISFPAISSFCLFTSNDC